MKHLSFFTYHSAFPRFTISILIFCLNDFPYATPAYEFPVFGRLAHDLSPVEESHKVWALPEFTCDQALSGEVTRHVDWNQGLPSPFSIPLTGPKPQKGVLKKVGGYLWPKARKTPKGPTPEEILEDSVLHYPHDSQLGTVGRWFSDSSYASDGFAGSSYALLVEKYSLKIPAIRDLLLAMILHPPTDYPRILKAAFAHLLAAKDSVGEKEYILWLAVFAKISSMENSRSVTQVLIEGIRELQKAKFIPDNARVDNMEIQLVEFKLPADLMKPGNSRTVDAAAVGSSSSSSTGDLRGLFPSQFANDPQHDLRNLKELMTKKDLSGKAIKTSFFGERPPVVPVELTEYSHNLPGLQTFLLNAKLQPYHLADLVQFTFLVHLLNADDMSGWQYFVWAEAFAHVYQEAVQEGKATIRLFDALDRGFQALLVKLNVFDEGNVEFGWLKSLANFLRTEASKRPDLFLQELADEDKMMTQALEYLDLFKFDDKLRLWASQLQKNRIQWGKETQMINDIAEMVKIKTRNTAQTKAAALFLLRFTSQYMELDDTRLLAARKLKELLASPLEIPSNLRKYLALPITRRITRKSMAKRPQSEGAFKGASSFQRNAFGGY